MKPAARLTLEQPHLADHTRSVEQVARKAAPRGLPALLHWFLTEWAHEVPDRIHKGDVWRDYVGLMEDRKAEGGSRLGSPQYAEAFRRYLEGSPFETDQDGRYARPIHAAIARICGRQGHEGPTERLAPYPYMARFLFRLATTGDVAQACASMGIPPQVQPIYAEQALYRLWRGYAVGPQAMENVA